MNKTEISTSRMLKLFAALSAIFLTASAYAADADNGLGIGPIKAITLEPLSKELATKGKETFKAKCSACHKMPERYVGPALGEVFKRRKPEWIMNMILNPTEMTQNDPTAKELFGEFLVQMTFQNVNQEEVRSILEYFRYYSEKGEIEDVAAPAAKSGAKKDTKSKKSKK